MRGYFAAAAGVALLGAGLCTAPQANAQGKAPLPTPQTKNITPVQFSEMQGGATQVDWREGYKHGRVLILTMKNKDKIAGRVVWSDEKSGKLYIRPQDGVAPIGVSFNDVSKVERIQLAAAKTGKGGIAPASIPERGVGPAVGPLPPDAPEIHVVRIANGDVITEQFYSNAISPREQSVLKNIEAAEREVAATRQLISELNIMLQNKSQLQDALVAQAQAQTTYLRILNNNARNYYWYGWVQEDTPLGLSYSSFPFRPYFNQHAYHAPYIPYTAPQYPVVQRIQNEAESFDPGRLVESIDIARRGLEKSQADLAMARSHAIYEGGNIVAVRLD